MNTTGNKVEIIKYETKGTCCRVIQIEICNSVIKNVEFFGGCNGNLQGLKALLQNMHIDEVIEKFSGIRCEDKNTSCPDQLAQCLVQYKSKKPEATLS